MEEAVQRETSILVGLVWFADRHVGVLYVSGEDLRCQPQVYAIRALDSRIRSSRLDRHSVRRLSHTECLPALNSIRAASCGSEASTVSAAVESG